MESFLSTVRNGTFVVQNKYKDQNNSHGRQRRPLAETYRETACKREAHLDVLKRQLHRLNDSLRQKHIRNRPWCIMTRNFQHFTSTTIASIYLNGPFIMMMAMILGTSRLNIDFNGSVEYLERGPEHHGGSPTFAYACWSSWVDPAVCFIIMHATGVKP